MDKKEESLAGRIGRIALLVALMPLIVLVGAVVLVLYLLHRAALYCFIWLLWLPKGKDVLLVQSDSPIWHDYMTTQVLPLVLDRAVVLNWSERHKWTKWSFPVHVFRSFAGTKEFNPIIVVFRPFRRARVFRFWSAFKHWKHGDTEPVTHLREKLLQIL
jgi:hypothetical protein